ncbi:MAG: amidohydrolase [Oscillospiraceae bacterium]
MQKIFYNGTIITMEKSLYAEAVLINDGVIEDVGSFDALHALAPSAELVDLAHKAMLPAFIDAHGHFSSYANAQMQVVLEEADCFSEIALRITSFIKDNKIESGKWIVAKGYDHNTLAEKRHPNIELLNEIAPDNPLILQHQSGHCGVLNTAALESLGINGDTPSPVGGVIGRENGNLTGYMEEDAYISCIKQVPMAGIDAMLGAYAKAQAKYLANGITTVQEGMMVAEMLPLYSFLIESGILKIDVVGYPDTNSMQAIAKAYPACVKKYSKHFKIGGYKIILDGSPQVKTAWMKTPYLNSDTLGYGTMSDEAVLLAVENATKENMQILAHCNGDAAIQQYINAVKEVAFADDNILKLRPVIIHSQLITEDELKDAAALNMIPSFFVAHVLHWGDIHIANFGYERAKHISPAHSAIKNNMIFTFHQDAPVIEPNNLETIQCAVTRKTKSGVSLGEDECISVEDAIKAVTINAAYQYSEENEKGSIKAGKHADFVIMDKSPLAVPKNEISKILITETIKDGITVFALNE